MAAATAATLLPRQFSGIGNDVNNVKTTFSSWDSCMSKAYCKWPVIAAIIIGSLILISILTCIFRCLCCGVECCCGCFRCCNACCPSPRRSRNDKYQPAPQQPYGPPPPAYGYQPQPGMHYGPQPAQFASFEASGARDGKPGQQNKYNEDSLPAMPSWANARERKVEDDVPVDEHKDSIPLQDQRPLHQAERDPMLPGVGAMPRSPSRTASPYRSPNPQQSPFHPPPSPSAMTSSYAPSHLTGYDPHNQDYPAAAEFPAGDVPAAGAAGVYGAGAYRGNPRSPPPHQQQRSPGPYLNTHDAHGYPGQVHGGAMELQGSSPTSPQASSVYTSTTYRGEPAPSYHSQPPMPAYGAGYMGRQDSSSRAPGGHSPVSPQQQPAYSNYTPFSQASELDSGAVDNRVAQNASQQSPFHQQRTSWGHNGQRKPVPGSWREV